MIDATPNGESIAKSAAQKASAGPKRILIADDEHLIAASLASNVRALGCTVIGPAANGQLAIELARAERPDLALLDIRMPVVDGLAAARVIWTELGAPVVIVSAYSDPENVDDSAEIGVFGYLLKPVDADSLRVAIAVAWSRAAALRDRDTRVRQLEQNLANRRTVEQAKWKLVERHGITEPEAHRRLQTTARNSRSALVDIAQRVLDNDATLPDV